MRATTRRVTSSSSERRYLPLPRTVEAVTGLLPGIDVRGDGGYVVALPSRHVSGGHYRRQVGQDPAAPTPAALSAWLADVAGHRVAPAVVGAARHPFTRSAPPSGSAPPARRPWTP